MNPFLINILSGLLRKGCILLLVFAVHSASSQCIQVDSLTALSFQGTFETDAIYTTPLALSADSNTTVTFRLANLRDGLTNNKLQNTDIQIITAPVALGAGVAQTIDLEIQGFDRSGSFLGTLELTSTGSDCPTQRISTVINLTTADQVVLSGSDQTLDVQMVNPASGKSRLLPPKLRPRTRALELQNQGEAQVQVQRIALLLQGEGTGAVITWDSLRGDWPNTLTLQGNSRTPLNLPLDALPSLSADKYTGNVAVYLDNRREPLVRSLHLYVRDGIFWPIVAILLGVIVGFLTRSLERNKTQVDAMQQLFGVSAKIQTLSSTLARQQLRLEVEKLESSIDDLSAEELPKWQESVEAIKEKITKIREAEMIYQKIENAVSSPDEIDRAYQILNNAINAFVEGDTDTGNERIEELNDILTASLGTKKRSLTFDKSAPDPTPPAPTAERPTQPEWWRRVLAFLTNRSKVLFYIVRPVSYAILLALVLLWGLQEIYFQDGSSTFGEDGIYDYLVLFGWGAASNILSWELVGKNLLNTKPAATPAQGSDS